MGFGIFAVVFLVLVSITAPKRQAVNLQQYSNAKSSQTLSAKPQAPTVTTKQETQTQSVPYTTQKQDDNSLAKGQTKVVQRGHNGTETLTYKITYTEGKQTDKTLTAKTITTPPVNQIVDIGTYVAPATSAPSAATSAPSASTATPQSCYPLSNGGNCYEPGEYCRNADHGTSGIAGDGKSIICENNNG